MPNPNDRKGSAGGERQCLRRNGQIISAKCGVNVSKRRARQAAQEEEAAEEVGTKDDAEEEVSSDVPLASSQDEKYIYSLDGNDVKKKLAAWHNQFSNEELQLREDCCECET